MITTNNLNIRHFTLEDANFILQLVNQDSWLQFIGDKNIHNTEDAKKYLLDGPIAMYNNHGFGLYAVETIESSQPIGMCGVIKRDTLPNADLGFAFLDEFTGKGYAYEACQGVLNYAKNNLQISTLLAITMPENEKSISLLEKLGFIFKEVIQLSENAPELNLMIRKQ